MRRDDVEGPLYILLDFKSSHIGTTSPTTKSMYLVHINGLDRIHLQGHVLEHIHSTYTWGNVDIDVFLF